MSSSGNMKSINDPFMDELNHKVNLYLSDHNLTKFANREMKTKIIFYIGLQLVSYYFMLTATTSLHFIFLYLSTGLVTILSAINIAHDAAHNVIFRNKKWNSKLYYFTFQLSGYNPDVWRMNHVIGHHTYPNVQDKDPHFPETKVFRFGPWHEYKSYHQYQHIYAVLLYSIHSVAYFFIEEPRIFLGLHKHIKLSRNQFWKGLLGKLVYLNLFFFILFLVTDFSLMLIILVFIAKHMIISIIMTLVLGINHFTETTSIYGKEENINLSWAQLQLGSTIDFATEKRWVYWIVGGFNAHALHHLFPAMCHMHYYKLTPIFKETIKKHNIPYQEVSFLKLLVMHFQYLEKMGQHHGKN